MKIALNGGWLLALVVFLGCESAAPPTASVSDAGAPPPPTPAAASEEPVPEAAPAAGAPAAAPGAAADGAPAAPPADGDDATVRKAEAGVGVKGKDYGDGFITTPISTMYRAEERIAFEAQIPKAMQLYKAAHDNKGPKTHAEFMEVIIKEHAIPLPVLREGEEFIYDPKTEELMVRTPKPK